MNIQTVGVVGAGVMGTGVAQNLAQAGFRVILLDISSDVLKRDGELKRGYNAAPRLLYIRRQYGHPIARAISTSRAPNLKWYREPGALWAKR